MHRLAGNETHIEVRDSARRDEIGDMARAVVVFRNNAIDLAQNRHALAQQAIILKEKLAEEQRLAMLQRNFVSMASHEFRTPLGIIDGHAQRMISTRDRLTAAELAERASKIRNAVHRMTQLIDNLIGSARLIDGGFDVHRDWTRVDIAALVRDVCQVQRELTPEADITAHIEDRGPWVDGDASLLSQVLGNLLSNAVKYSPDNSPVRVTAAPAGEHVTVVVEDHGIGIPAAECEYVFQRYYRASNTSRNFRQRRRAVLVKIIVESHEGGIEVASREGQGSRFRLTLPKAGWPQSSAAGGNLDESDVIDEREIQYKANHSAAAADFS